MRGATGRLMCAWIAVLLLAGALSNLEVRADYVETLNARLVTGLQDTSAVWDGAHAYVFGGSEPDYRTGSDLDSKLRYYDYIIEFSPSTNTTRLLDTRLPVRLAGTSAIYDGRYAYIFGGFDGSITHDSILRFDPLSEKLSTLPTKLPEATWGGSATWDGKSAYVIGGQRTEVDSRGLRTGDLVRKVVRFTPATSSVEVTSTGWALHSQTSAWNGESVIIFDNLYRTTLRFDPETRAITKMNSTVPGSASFFYSGWDSNLSDVVLIGDNEILRYNVSSDLFMQMRARLPVTTREATAVQSTGALFIFGGWTGNGPGQLPQADQIVRYSLTPGNPTNTVAVAGPGPGNVTIAWGMPAPDTYTNVDGFRIYRSEFSDFRALTQVATVRGKLSFIDVGLPSNTTRFYRVIAFNGAGESTFSEPAAATTFPPARGADGPITVESPDGPSPDVAIHTTRGASMTGIFGILMLILLAALGMAVSYVLYRRSPESKAHMRAHAAVEPIRREVGAQRSLVSMTEQQLDAQCGRLLEDTMNRRMQAIPLEDLRKAGARNVRWAALQQAGIRTLADLKSRGANDLRQIRGVGAESAHRVIAARDKVVQSLRAEPVGAPAPELMSSSDLAVSRAAIHLVEAREVNNAFEANLRHNIHFIERSLSELDGKSSYRHWVRTRIRRESPDLEPETSRIVEEAERLSSDVRYVESIAARQRIIQSMNSELPVHLVRDRYKEKFADFAALIEQRIGAQQFGRSAGPAGRGRRHDAGHIPNEIADRVDNLTLRAESMRVTLRRYQEFGAKYLLVQRRTLLGDEMGVGKTMQALAAMTHLAQSSPERQHFLVVAPAGVVYTWLTEIRERTVFQPFMLVGTARTYQLDQWLATGGIAVSSYTTFATGSLTRTLRENGIRLSMFVADEAHYIKNPEAKRTRAVQETLPLADHVTFMTGTPLENRLEEFVALVNLLQPDVARQITHEGGIEGEIIVEPNKFHHAVSPVYLRRNTKDVLSELPEKIDMPEWVELNSADLAAYRGALSSNNFMAARRAVTIGAGGGSSSKMERLKELVDEHRASGKKILVFSFFLDVLSEASMVCGSSMLITGAVPASERASIVRRFDESPDPCVLLAQIQAGGVGVNLQAASVVILMEPQWKPTTEDQAVARAHRMGQTERVIVHRLLARDSLDERMLETIKNKTDIFERYAKPSLVKTASPHATGVDLTRATERQLSELILETERSRMGVGESPA